MDFHNIANKAGAFVWLYNATAEYYGYISYVFSGLLIVLSYFVGIGGTATTFTLDEDFISYINLITYIISLIVGSIEALHRFLNLEEKIARSRWAAAKYSNIFREIRRQKKFSKSFAEKINELEKELEDAPPIPKIIFWWYNRKMKENAIPYQELYNMSIRKNIQIKGKERYYMEKYFISSDELIQ